MALEGRARYRAELPGSGCTAERRGRERLHRREERQRGTRSGSTVERNSSGAAPPPRGTPRERLHRREELLEKDPERLHRRAEPRRAQAVPRVPAARGSPQPEGPRSPAMERLEEELTCALCRDIFSEPRLLPCSHTFCGPCLRALPPPGPGAARPRCPTCRAPLALPAAGPQALPRNFAIQAVIDKWRRQQEPPGDGAGAGDGVGTCSAHPRQPLNVYCLQDQQLVCGQCLTVGEHRGHPIDDLQSAHSKGREAWGRLRQELQEPSRAEELAQRLKEQRGLCLCALDSDREAVRRYFKEVGDVLEHQKTALLSQLDELEGQIFEKYNPLLEEVEKLKLEESELKELHGAVQEEAPVRFLKELPGLKLRLHSLKQRQLPEPEALEIRPRIEKVLHERCKTELGQLHTIPTPKLYLAPKGKYTWKEILMAVWETLNQRPWLE